MHRKKTPPAANNPDTSPERTEARESMFRIFFDCLPVATAIVGNDGTIAHVNDKFLELSGYRAADIEGKKRWMEFIAPEDLERVVSYHRELVRPGGWAPPVSSFGFVRKDGSVIPGQLMEERVHGISAIIVTVTDYSDRKKIETLLRSNEERYRTMVNSLSVGLFKSRLESPGKLLWANPALVRMYGCDSLGDFTRRPIRDYYADPKDRERFTGEILARGAARNFEVLHRKKDGTPFWVRITASPRKREDGTIEWIEGSIEDIDSDRSAVLACETGRQYLHEMIHSALGVGLICTDTNGTITLFNRGAENLLGYTAAEVTGKTPLIFHTEEEILARSRILSGEAGRLVEGFEILTLPLAGSTLDERQWTYRKKDGSTIIVQISITRIQSDDGTGRGYLLWAKEITEEKRLEEAFRASALQMSGVIYNLPDATYAIDREGKVIAWNRSMEILTGIKAVEILGKGNYEYAIPFHGTRRPMLIDLISATDETITDWGYNTIRRKGIAVSAESPATDQANTLRILWSVAAPIYSEDGERAGAIESLADVTESRKKEASLEDSVQKYREILDNTGAATAIIEEDDTCSFVNPEFERILGYVREEVEGKKKWTDFIAPDDMVHLQDVRKQQFDPAGYPIRYELRFIRWDGTPRNGFFIINRIPGSNRMVMTLLDLTDKIRAENAVREANRKLNFLNSITRHDILNQLTVLKGNLELSREETTDPLTRTVIEKELAAAESIQTLITFTRDHQDIGIEPPEWQDLRGVILKACEGIRLAGITVSVEIEGVEVYADRLLQRVFSDLVRNAIGYGKKTTRVRLFCEESFEELHIICADDGAGIPTARKERIFTREGLLEGGLNLYLAREILSITGIGIRETGIEGTGAEFELRVPHEGYRFTAAR